MTASLLTRGHLLQCILKNRGHQIQSIRTVIESSAPRPRKTAPSLKKPNRIVDVIFLTVPLTAFGLGVWQIKRKQFKEALLKKIDVNRAAPSECLPHDLSDLYDWEYRTVTVTGHFLHNKEIILGPRRKEIPGQTWTTGEKGMNVVTPFKLSDTGNIILINRGWIPETRRIVSNRLKGQIPGEVTLSGMLRLPEKNMSSWNKAFVKDQSGFFLKKDVEEMAKVAQSYPVLIDANKESTVEGGPLGGQYKLFIYNSHMQYIITWFLISAITSSMWWRHFKR